MTTELKKQKLQEYLETATSDEIEIMYADYLDETGPVDHSEEFWAEIEQRRKDYESGKDKGVSLQEAMDYARQAIQNVKHNAAVSH